MKSKFIFVIVFLGLLVIALSFNAGAVAPCRTSEEYITRDCNDANKHDCNAACESIGYEAGIGFWDECGNDPCRFSSECTIGCECEAYSGCSTCGIKLNATEGEECSSQSIDDCESYYQYQAPPEHYAFSCMIHDWNCVMSTFYEDCYIPECTTETQDVDCNDYNECTIDTCDSGNCSNPLVDDNTPCDTNGICQAGLCVIESPPKIQNLTILPDYPSLERDNLTYEEIFPLKPYVKLNIESDAEEETFKVNYTLTTTFPLERNKKNVVFSGEKTCGKECIIDFTSEGIDQKVLLRADVKVYDQWGNSDPVHGKATAYRFTPSFNLKLVNINSGNVLFGTKLVEHKPIALMGYYNIESELITPEVITGKIEKYIDSINDIKFSLYIDYKEGDKPTQQIIKNKVERYIDFKPGLLAGDPAHPDPELIRAARETKVGNRTANFMKIFPAEGAKEIKYLMVIEDNKTTGEKINDINPDDNSKEEAKEILKQKDDNFKVGLGEFKLYTAYYEKEMFDGGWITVKIWKVWNEPTSKQNNEGLSKEAYDGLVRAFPIDPTKTQAGNFMRYGLEVSPLSVSKKWASLRQLQRIGDEEGDDLIYGIVNKDIINKDEGTATSGRTVPLVYKRAAIIGEYNGINPGTFMHEAGHLLIGEENSKGCTAIFHKAKDIGVISDDGWCLFQDTGEPCRDNGGGSVVGGSVVGGSVVEIAVGFEKTNGANINVWKEESRDEDGCYSTSDQPQEKSTKLSPYGDRPTTKLSLGDLRPDIMTSESIAVWPLSNTYGKLMDHFLNFQN